MTFALGFAAAPVTSAVALENLVMLWRIWPCGRKGPLDGRNDEDAEQISAVRPRTAVLQKLHSDAWHASCSSAAAMAHVVDRLLFWRNRAERLEADLLRTDPSMHGLIRAKLTSAQKTQRAAFAALISAAQGGDPEAIVALD
ncbi:MAG: hypothetical protein E6J87_25410, partial [Deltaproteobacteria bacterium]